MAVFCLQRRHLDFSSWRGPGERDGSASLLPMSARQRTLSSSKAGLQVCGGKPRFYIRIRLFSAKRKFSRFLVCPRPHSRSLIYLYHVFDYVHGIIGIIVAYVERSRVIGAERIVGKVKGASNRIKPSRSLRIKLMFQRLRCQHKEPCRLFTVRKRRSSQLEEVNASPLCQCPKGHRCPRRHTDPGSLPARSYSGILEIKTYSGYCVPSQSHHSEAVYNV